MRSTLRRAVVGVVRAQLFSTTTHFFQTRAAASVNQAATGLYGFDHLKSPEGFLRFAEDAIERLVGKLSSLNEFDPCPGELKLSGELVNYISGMPSGPEIIRAMDEISDAVCSVVDSAELCRRTHPDRAFIEAGNNAAMKLEEYIHFLNTNQTLYNAVKRAEQDGSALSREAQRAAYSLRLDFEKGGIHLPTEKLERVNQLNMDIFHLCQEFNSNIMCDPGHVDIYPANRIPKHLVHLARPIYRTTSRMSETGSKQEKGYRIPTDPGNVSTVLQCAQDTEVRRLVYCQGNCVPRANLDVINKLMAARHELSQIMGFKSYAELVVSSNMASSPEVVQAFLLEMSNMVRPKAEQELQMIKKYKQEHSGQMMEDLEPWDETYFTAMMKSSMCNLDSTIVASYFPVTQCLEGLKVLVESLFGATFHSVPLAPGESWHPDVTKISLHHPDEGDLGFLYLDLYHRKGKYPGCAHFAIKGGRQLSESDYQLPVVALVCNFSNPQDSSITRLNHGEVETLFHEFGHALHSLLSRTDYQHFSGTRVALDLAETPSNLFEYFAWDYRVLKTFARHYSSGEVIPEKLVEEMNAAKNMFAATELQRQVFYAMMDQKLFGEPTSSHRDTVTLIADLKRQYTSWKHVDGTHWHTRFTHLLNYGAGYYSYLYAKCLSSTMWQSLFLEDPLSREAGTALRMKFLKHGGAKEPADLLTDLVGEKVIRYREGRKGVTPDITCLCKEMKILDGDFKSE